MPPSVLTILPQSPITDPPEQGEPVLAHLGDDEYTTAFMDADGHWWEYHSKEPIMTPEWWAALPADHGLTRGMLIDAAAAMCTWSRIKYAWGEDVLQEVDDYANIIRRSINEEEL